VDVPVPDQRLFNFIDDNVLISQFLAPLEVGHEEDTLWQKPAFFVDMYSNEYGSECFHLWGPWGTVRVKLFNGSVIKNVT
jgi:hypothetical protein